MKLLTQTDVVNCILSNANSFPPIQNALSVSIEATKGSYELIAVSENNLLISAIDELRLHSAIAITNEWGKFFFFLIFFNFKF